MNKYHRFVGTFLCWPPAFVSIRLIISLQKAVVCYVSALCYFHSLPCRFYLIQIEFTFSASLSLSLIPFQSHALLSGWFFLSLSPLICTSCFKIYESLSPFISLLKHNNVHRAPEAVSLNSSAQGWLIIHKRK